MQNGTMGKSIDNRIGLRKAADDNEEEKEKLNDDLFHKFKIIRGS